jgi:hypothetical protein
VPFLNQHQNEKTKWYCADYMLVPGVAEVDLLRNGLNYHQIREIMCHTNHIVRTGENSNYHHIGPYSTNCLDLLTEGFTKILCKMLTSLGVNNDEASIISAMKYEEDGAVDEQDTEDGSTKQNENTSITNILDETKTNQIPSTTNDDIIIPSTTNDDIIIDSKKHENDNDIQSSTSQELLTADDDIMNIAQESFNNETAYKSYKKIRERVKKLEKVNIAKHEIEQKLKAVEAENELLKKELEKLMFG